MKALFDANVRARVEAEVQGNLVVRKLKLKRIM
jgi:hypothetical protein